MCIRDSAAPDRLRLDVAQAADEQFRVVVLQLEQRFGYGRLGGTGRVAPNGVGQKVVEGCLLYTSRCV